jgi:hypothetical protein
VIGTNKRRANKVVIVTKGNKTRLLRRPGIAKVRLVINKLVKDIVVLIPAKITEIIRTS